MIIRKSAGAGLVLASLGMAALSGTLAYHGLTAMVPIPHIGWAGPMTALACVCLGLGLETVARESEWGRLWRIPLPPLAVIVLAVMLAGAAMTDRHYGSLSLKSQVSATADARAGTAAAYAVAVSARDAAGKRIVALSHDLSVLTGPDIPAAQRLLGVRPDGKWGPQTLGEYRKRETGLRADLAQAEADARSHAEAAALPPPAEAAFSGHDAETVATVITLLSVLLAFAGSWLWGAGKPPVQDPALAELPAALERTTAKLRLIRDAVERQTA